MAHTYRVIRVATGFKIKSATKTHKQIFKSKASAQKKITNLYKLARGKHKKGY